MKASGYPQWFRIIGVVILALDSLLVIGVLSATGDYYSYSGDIVYPLFVHFTSPTFPAPEIVFAGLGMVTLIASIRQSDRHKPALLSLVGLLIAVVIILWGSGSALIGRAPQPVPLNSIAFQGNVYQLLVNPCYKMDSVCPPAAYIVLKCDTLGVICRLWAIPWSETDYNKITLDSRLVIKSGDSALFVQIGERTFQIAGTARSVIGEEHF